MTRSWPAAKSSKPGGGGGGVSKVAAALCTARRGQAILPSEHTHAEITATSEGGESVTSQVAGMTPPSMRTELRA